MPRKSRRGREDDWVPVAPPGRFVRQPPVVPDPASLQPWLLIVLYVATIALVWRRSVFYRRFVMILMGILCLIWWGLSAQLPPVVGWVFVALRI